MRIAAICLISSMSLLAACSKGPATTSAGSAPSGTPAGAPAATTPNGLLSVPHRKPGLWKVSFSTDSGPGVRMSAELCIDEKTDQSTSYGPAAAAAGKDCTRSNMRPSPDGGFAFDSTCKIGVRTVTTHGVVSGDFNSNYTVAITNHMEPPIRVGTPDVKTQIQAVWEGPCKPGQKPGGMSAMKFAGLGRG